MEFRVNYERKKEIQKVLNKTKKSVRVIKMLEKMFLFLGIGGGALYALLQIFIPNWGMVNLRGVPTKDYFSIAMWTTLIVIEGFVIYLLTKMLRKGLERMNITDRIDEQLAVEENELAYIYRIEYQSLPTERIVIKIPLNEVNVVSYEKNSSKFIFEGLVYGDYVTVQEGMNQVALQKDDNGKIIIYDYFKPSLKETLEKKGIILNYI